MYIYVITNLINGKFYVGQTISDVSTRWSDHKANAKYGNPHGICRAIRKYGEAAFDIREICQCADRDELSRMERLWILSTRAFDPKVGYNRSYGGEGCGIRTEANRSAQGARQKGYKPSPAQLEALKLGRTSYPRGPMAEYHKRAISIANTGRVVSPERRERISEGKKGKPAKLGSLMALAAWKGRTHTPESVEKMKQAQSDRRKRERLQK